MPDEAIQWLRHAPNAGDDDDQRQGQRGEDDECQGDRALDGRSLQPVSRVGHLARFHLTETLDVTQQASDERGRLLGFPERDLVAPEIGQPMRACVAHFNVG